MRRSSNLPAPPKLAYPTVASTILNLPGDVLMEILSTLGMKTICSCRRVCKYLREIISDPCFAELQLPRSSTTVLIRSTDYEDPKLYMLESVQENITYDRPSNIISVPKETILKFTPQFGHLSFDLRLLSTCNGLICFHSPRTYNPYYICNPCLNEYAIVPQIEDDLFFPVGSGFGFSPKTNQYKVLRFIFPINSCDMQGLVDWEVEIITLGTNLWRKVGVAPRNLLYSSGGIFLNGALHWILHDSSNIVESVCCFDFEEERFKVLEGPYVLFDRKEGGEPDVFFCTLGLINSELCIFHHPSTHILDVWFLNTHVDNHFWFLGYSIALVWPVDRYGLIYQPITCWNGGEILMSYGSAALVSYDDDYDDPTLTEVRINGIPRFLKAMEYVPSFVSIKNVANGVA